SRPFPIPLIRSGPMALMKPKSAELLSAAATTLKTQGTLPADLEPRIQSENTRDKAHGDLATNLAMMLAKPAGKNPRDLAQLLVPELPVTPLVPKRDIAGPGRYHLHFSDRSPHRPAQARPELPDPFARHNHWTT